MVPRFELCHRCQELFKPCRAQSCNQPSRRVHFPPWLCWDISVTLVGSKKQHWSVKISVKLLKQELLKHPAPVFTPQLNTFISSITGVFFLRAAPGGALCISRCCQGGDEQ